MEVVPLFKEGEEGKVSGPELLRRASNISDFGLNKGQAIINNWWQLPENIWPDQEHSINVALPGTLVMIPDGRVCMNYISMYKSWKRPDIYGGRVINLPDETYEKKDWFAIRQKKTETV